MLTFLHPKAVTNLKSYIPVFSPDHRKEKIKCDMQRPNFLGKEKKPIVDYIKLPIEDW